MRLAVLRRQRDPLEEEALVALQRQVVEPDARLGAHLRDDLGDVRLDHLEPEVARDRNPVMAVMHEMHVRDPVDLDRRHRLASPHRLGDPLPAALDPARGGTEAAVELAGPVNGSDDRVEVDRREAEAPLALPSQGSHDLVEGEDHVDVAGLPPEPASEVRTNRPAACAAEIGLGVLTREAGVHANQVRTLLR